MQPIIPQALAAGLPFVATMVSRLLADDRLSSAWNALIAALFLVLTAVACVWLSGNWTGNAQASILLILAWVAFLMRGDLAVLMQFFDLTASPVANMLLGKPVATSPTPLLFTAQPSRSGTNANTQNQTPPVQGG